MKVDASTGSDIQDHSNLDELTGTADALWVVGSEMGSQRLTRRPAESAAAQQMQMHVENRLAGRRARVHHDAMALRQAMLLGQLRRYTVQMSQQMLIALTSLCCGGEVLPGNHQQMHRGLRVDVVKRHAV